VLASATAAGLSPLLLVDFPHRTPARKYFLHLTRPADSKAAAAAAAGVTATAAAAAAAAPECPLSWHIGGTCSLWHKQQLRQLQRQQQQHQGGAAAAAAAAGEGSFGVVSEAACHDVADAWMQQQQQQDRSTEEPGQVHSHPQQQQQLQRVVCGVDAWVATFHLKHCKKLLRLMWRAGLDSGAVSILPQQQQQQQHCLEDSTSHTGAAAAAGVERVAGDCWLKVVLQLELPVSLLHGNSQGSSSSSGAVQQSSQPAVAASRQLNCYGNCLLVSCIGRADDLAAAATAAAEGSVAEFASSCQEQDAAATADHTVAKQLASALATSMQQRAEQQQQQQQEAVQVQVLSAEVLAAADLAPQRPTPQQQQSKRPRRARKQFMQAALVPLPNIPEQQQQQQQRDVAAGGAGAYSSSSSSSSSWMQLDVAIGFAPHLVYSMSLPGWQASPQHQQQQQQQQQQQHIADAGSRSSSGAAGIAEALLQGVHSVRASHAGLGVYGALLVMHGNSRDSSEAGGLQMLMGCYGKQ
jgi:hypothetical protein